MKFQVFTLEKSWRDARAYCRNMGGDLATFSSYVDQTIAMSRISGSDRKYWIGLSDFDKDGRWDWSDGSTSSWSRWQTYYTHRNEVYDSKYNNQECASIYWPEGRWYSDPCDQSKQFVCKVPGIKIVLLTQ